MCGIAGFVGKGTEEDLRKMTGTLRHRGPDHQQVIVREGAGFGHARLSIIDLAPEANQPFFSTDGKTMIIFNGEIYNFPALKNMLEKSFGVRFRTSSDTEVLIALYQQFGEDMLRHITGMFAFAIHDFTRGQLLLARDRMGEKPLYYCQTGSTIIFASEIKALLQHPLVGKEIDLQALHNYLIFDYVPSPRSIFKQIRKLEPGTCLTFLGGNVETKKYWDVSFGKSSLSFEDATSEFSSRLEQSVAGRLLSDVPLGFFLSGGIDSSAIAYFAQKHSSRKIKTFSIGFENPSYDESKYARLVAEQLGTDHSSEILTESAALELIPFIGQSIDEPFADASIIPTCMLSMSTRKHVTVALGGDGSDELLAGYPTFIADRFAWAIQAAPKISSGLMGLAGRVLPVSDDNISLDFKITQFRKGVGQPRDYVHSLWLSTFTPATVRKLWNPAFYREINSPDRLEPVHHALNDQQKLSSQFNRNALVYYKTYLPDDILFKVDRASMLASLEVRAPFLDHTLVEFINTLPPEFKRKGFTTKRILKEAMKGKLPDTIISRPKKGFGIPLSAWLKKDLRKLCDDLLSPAAMGSHGFFDQRHVDQLKAEHYASRKNHRKELWNLMMFQMWYINHVKGH